MSEGFLPWQLILALGLDLVLGDPHGYPHPVVLVGRFIERMTDRLEGSSIPPRVGGILLLFSTLAVTAVATLLLLRLAGLLSPVLGALVAALIAYTTLALRSLHRESLLVAEALDGGDLLAARSALAMIVGRDTAHLDQEGVTRALIETVAENASDGVIAPLFYLCLGGPVLAICFKAASTLDSMVGYKNDRFLYLGWASARFDDLLNYIPARLTALLLIAAAALSGGNARGGWRMVQRDGRNHASPNAGIPEAAAAGILGVQLGGGASYGGRWCAKPTIGDALTPPTTGHYRQLVRLVYLAAGLLALGGLVIL